MESLTDLIAVTDGRIIIRSRPCPAWLGGSNHWLGWLGGLGHLRRRGYTDGVVTIRRQRPDDIDRHLQTVMMSRLTGSGNPATSSWRR
jgi:hypothetical protein